MKKENESKFFTPSFDWKMFGRKDERKEEAANDNSNSISFDILFFTPFYL